MKLALIAAVSLLAGCRDDRRDAPRAAPAGSAAAPASSAPSPVPPVPAAPPSGPAGSSAPAAPGAPGPAAAPAPPGPDLCRRSLEALDRATCATEDARAKLGDARRSIDQLVTTITRIGGAGSGSDARQFQVMCGQMLLALERDAAKLGCTVALSAPQRAELTALLDAWYGQRTAVVPTGHAPSDAVISKLAAVRDAACACRNAACLDRLDAQLVAIGPMPPAAPDAARTLGSKLLDEAGRCASRLRMGGAPPP
jgi:hypothetical protein